MKFSKFACSLGWLTLAFVLLLLVSAAQLSAQTETVLYSFTGGVDGAFPCAGVIRDHDNLYGTTFRGGLFDWGSVFEISPGGSETVLYSFTGGEDGGWPCSPLKHDAQGNLYGTTEIGGPFGNSGTLFKLMASGTEKVLYGFERSPDGSTPLGNLVRDEQGNFYGTTVYGGVPVSGSIGGGIVFKVSPSGVETVLYTFTGPPDGANPQAGLVRDTQGNLYGTTFSGGAFFAYGTVFKLSPNGTETVLYSFKGGQDGSGPDGTLARDPQGNLYGTTIGGGSSAHDGFGDGTVFKLSPSGVKTVLHKFDGRSDGSSPEAGLIRDGEGNLYGTTYSGGTFDLGTVFKVNPSGVEKVLYSFKGAPDGANPNAALIRDKGGNLYGTTLAGGAHNAGTVFKLAP